MSKGRKPWWLIGPSVFLAAFMFLKSSAAHGESTTGQDSPPSYYTQNNYRLSPAAEKFFFNNPKRARRFYEEMEKIKAFLPKSEPGEIYDSCAIVGSSSNLTGSNYGALIDSHAAVMRFNNAPTEGYEEDVGHKTTHRTFFEGAVRRILPKAGDSILMFREESPSGVPAALMRIKKETEGVGADLFVIHHDLFFRANQLYDDWLQRKPSSGFLGIVWAVNNCNQVSILGLGPDRNGVYGYYFRNRVHKPSKKRKVRHSFDAERGPIQKMVRENDALTFYAGNVKEKKGKSPSGQAD